MFDSVSRRHRSAITWSLVGIAVLIGATTALLKPKNEETTVSSGIQSLKSGDLKGAISNFESALKANPDDALTNALLCVSSNQAGEHQKALEHCKKAISIYEGPKARKRESGEIELFMLYSTQGSSQYFTGSEETAIDSYTRSIELKGDISHTHEMRGNIRYQIGAILSACGDWKSAAELGSVKAEEYIDTACNK